MKFATLLTVAAGLWMTGCSSAVFLNPIATTEEIPLDPSLTGIWKSAGDEGLFVIRAVASHYDITLIDGPTNTKLEAVPFRVGDARLLDVATAADDPLQVPVHIVVRIWTEPSRLRWTMLDSDWLKARASEMLANQRAKDRTLFTSSSPAVRAFFTKYGADERAYEKTEILEKQ